MNQLPEDLARIMIWVFWSGLAVVGLIDLYLAIRMRRLTFSRQARFFGRDIPVAAYIAGLLPTHFWLNYPISSPVCSIMAVVGGAVVVLLYEVFTDAPLHPFVAFLFGLPIGALFFPN